MPSGVLRGANVLLVTIDTLRADRVGAHDGPSITPTLDRLAAAGATFSAAYAHVPMTLPSHASILTGLTPVHHGVRNNGGFRLGDTVETLATRLKGHGYRTGAFVGAFVLDARFGLARGFDEYDDRYGEDRRLLSFGYVERRAPQVLAPAAAWIGRATGQPWFAWVHLYDPHAPYDAPDRLVSTGAHAAYDNEVAYVDRELGRTLQELQSHGLLERTLIIVTSDHGESLGEHGESTHGLFAYESTLRVPLVMVGPGVPARTIATPRVGHVDILPTVLDLIGLPAPTSALDGRSLRSLMEGRRETPRAIYFEALDANLTRDWAPLTGVIDLDRKLIDLPLPELYDLARDPDESTNLHDVDATTARRLVLRVEDLRRPLSEPAAPATTAAPDRESVARLQALGYVGGTGGATTRTYGDADDPKRLVALNERFTTALRLASDRRVDEAMGVFRASVESRPTFIAAWATGAKTLLDSGRPHEALEWLSRAPAPVQSAPDILRHAAGAYLAAGSPGEAVRVLEVERNQHAPSVDSLNLLGIAYGAVGRIADARRAFEASLALAPRSAGTWNNLGVLALREGREQEALDAFREAVTFDPSYVDAWLGLGQLQVSRAPDEAIASWRKALSLEPGNFDTLFNLAMLLADRRPADALPVLRRFVAEAPADRYASDIAKARAILTRLDGRS
ncbi:MAG: sulfatase-like hydrolase/transferase [Vicinamibacterales bacterium]